MADTDLEFDPNDPAFNAQLKSVIQQRFINQVGPFKVVDLLHQIDKDVLTEEDIEFIKSCTKNNGNYVGAEVLLNKLTQYKGWFACLMSALQQVLPEVATKLARDHDKLKKEFCAQRDHQVHLRDGKGCTSLLDAASRGHIGCLLDLFNGHVDLNSKNERGETAAYLAAAGGHTDCLEILIQAGCDFDFQNEDNNSPLYVAAKHGFFHCIKALIGAAANVEALNKYGFTVTWAAAVRGHVECLQLLLNAGTSADNLYAHRYEDGLTPLMAAALAGQDKCVQMLIDAGAAINKRDRRGRTPLLIAAMEGKVKCLQVLIEAGADVNTPAYGGETPLYLAAGYHEFECVTLLLSAGADIHKTTKRSETALMMAATVGDEESLKALIDAGANLNTQDTDGKTALMKAAKGHMDIGGQILVENGADIHIRDKSGKSAIHYAAGSYSLLLTILADLGADVDAADNNGETPLMIAEKQSRYDALHYLARKSAHVDNLSKLGKNALWLEDMKLLTEIKTSSERDSPPVQDSGVTKTKETDGCEEPNTTLASDVESMEVLNRPVDAEYCIEPEDTLQQGYSGCQKNPGHVGFIPITEFGLSHLPDKYRDQRIVDVIKAEAELTVRLLVNYTSPARPDGYNASNLKGKKKRRCGSGLIEWVREKFTTEDNTKCPCPVCETSGDPKMEWGNLRISTAMHVIYDSSEAKNTVVHIFADVDKPEDMHKLYGYDVQRNKQDGDYCSILVATHDLRVWNYLKTVEEHRSQMWNECRGLRNKFVAIVSHPHGCSKQVTMGEWMVRHPTVYTDVASRYIYNVPTCPGSSGAPVIVFGRINNSTDHAHSGTSSEPGHNLSAEGADNSCPSSLWSPSVCRYWKEGKGKNGTGNFLPKGWDTLIEPEQPQRSDSPVQPKYDFQQRPLPQASF